MSEPTTTQEGVLSVFRGVAHNLTTQSEKAAAREHELKPLIAEAKAGREVLTKQIESLQAQANELDGEIARMTKEHDEAAAHAVKAGAEGTYAYSIIALAEQASTTETSVDGLTAGQNGGRPS